MKRRIKPVLRGKPRKDETQKIIARFQESGKTWRKFLESLAPQDRSTFEREIDQDAAYNDLLEQATPDDALLESIRREMASGFEPWAAHAIAKFSVEFYLRKKITNSGVILEHARKFRKGKITSAKYTAAVKKSRTRKELASQLGVSLQAVRDYERKAK